MTQRVEIEVIGYDKRDRNMGKATRVLAAARTQEFLLDNVDHLKNSIKVGQCGHHVIKISNGVSVAERVDMGRRGTKAAVIGEFVVKQG